MPAPALDLLGFWSSVLSSLFLSPDSAITSAVIRDNSEGMKAKPSLLNV